MRTAAALLAVILGLSATRPAARPESRAFAVIVASDAKDQHPSRDAIALIYRRKQLFWSDGTRIQPVNLPPAHPLRREFSECLLGQTPEDMEDYWRERYFHGVLPPHVLASEEAVVLFVQSTPGAIGYVSSCPSDARVHVVLTVGNAPNCPHRPATCVPLQD